MNEIKKIALLGPESTGKTTLCEKLASHFKTVCVPEYSREYLEKKDNIYSYEDVLHCTHEQMKRENEMYKQANRFLFCDTELINFKVWLEDVFNKAPSWLEEKIKEHRYDLILLTYPDIPFEKDKLRVNPHRREFFFEWYRRELINYKFHNEVIKGLGDERTESAITIIEKYFPT
jgi:NadR type nicotinamide-nucleotide adenylyltransferase